MEFKKSAGLAIIYDKKILLAHSTGSSWKTGFGIPKGGIEKGESNLDAAIREVGEEVGIHIKPHQIEKAEKTFTVIKPKSYSKVVYYYYVKINSLDEIGLKDLRVPKKQLQLKEIDWAGFMDYNEAIKKVTKSQIPVINSLKNEGLLERKSTFKYIKLFEKYLNDSKGLH